MPLLVGQDRQEDQLLNWKAQFIDRPSIKYTPVDPPNAVIMAQARQEPRPVLAPRTDTKDWCSKARDKLRLSSRLVASRTNGKYAELVGHEGGRYVGETVGGKQHGHGQYYAPAAGSGTNYILQYDGDWAQGQRHGYGMEYDASGEIYVGTFHNGKRQGFGRLQYACGDVYEGEWRDGVHHGRGTCMFANGDVFEGSFINGSRQGLGILLRPAKGLAHVWEYIKGSPQSGTVLEINGDMQHPRAKIVRDMIERHNRRMRLEGPAAAATPELEVRLPATDLAQPNAVFHTQAVKIRSMQGQGSSQTCTLPTAALTAPQLERLRHAFELLCQGSGQEAGVRAHQLPEIMVMAGMDLSAVDTRNALAEMGQALKAHQDHRLPFEDFLRIVDHYVSNGKR
eukprot:jgi/Ulvmu1/9834/UM056_0075.1